MERADIVIVGGGAAGLTAAIFAGETLAEATHAKDARDPSIRENATLHASNADARGHDEPRAPASVFDPESRIEDFIPRVLILDSAKSLGAKILVSGGGRCNVTHHQVVPEDFNAKGTIVRNVLAAFDAQAAAKWFDSLGVKLKREPTGKLFPTTDSSRTVLNALTSRCAALGVETRTDCRVTGIIPNEADPATLLVRHAQGETTARAVIVATGGKSLPKTGSDGTAWDMLARLGHTVTSQHAALVPLVLDAQMFHSELSGLSHEAELITFIDDKPTDRRTGSVLWTHFGLSGPVAMDASRHWTTAFDAGRRAALRMNFLPGESTESAEVFLLDATASRPRQSILRTLASRLYERVAAVLLARAGVNSVLPLNQLPKAQRRTLATLLTRLDLPVVQHRGWNYAEVTAGGVPLGEIDFRTMASRKVPGLFLAGETLDCDGRIGGFNFQWAWATGHLAGRAAARKIL